MAANSVTKEIRHTAIWGSNFPRLTGFVGNWLGIPMGYMAANVPFGTNSDPDTSYTLTVAADDLCDIIWQPLSNIQVRKCRIYYGQGGTPNTTHGVSLMRYDIDADGDLTNGVSVGTTAIDSNSDDRSQLRYTDLAITTDNTITTSQVLIGMVMPIDISPTAMAAKCIIEYTN
tara:strand:+ start:20 stop:538 length:519 start_codon:yes stop_codon:yes gene_type:complete